MMFCCSTFLHESWTASLLPDSADGGFFFAKPRRQKTDTAFCSSTTKHWRFARISRSRPRNIAQIPLGSSRHDTTCLTCQDLAFWLCRACRTARLDTLVSMRSTRRTCCVVSEMWRDEPSGIWAYLSQHISLHTSARITWSSSIPLLHMPFRLTSFVRRSFSTAAPLTWNSPRLSLYFQIQTWNSSVFYCFLLTAWLPIPPAHL